jgi:hypothetical protein
MERTLGVALGTEVFDSHRNHFERFNVELAAERWDSAQNIIHWVFNR